jgi:hypothetical protein
MAEVTNELMYELLKQIHSDVSDVKAARNQAANSSIRGRELGQQTNPQPMAFSIATTNASTASSAASNCANSPKPRNPTAAAMKSAVVLLPGLNRDRDMIAALTKISGKAPVTVWETDTTIPDVDLIVIPGGFSYGDYLRCGAIAARMPVMRAVAEKAKKGVHGHGRVQRLPDPARGRPAARRADAQRLAEIRLPRGEARGRQRQHRLHAQLCAGPGHPLPRRPS